MFLFLHLILDKLHKVKPNLHLFGRHLKKTVHFDLLFLHQEMLHMYYKLQICKNKANLSHNVRLLILVWLTYYWVYARLGRRRPRGMERLKKRPCGGSNRAKIATVRRQRIMMYSLPYECYV